jgi:hypothetical protein
VFDFVLLLVAGACQLALGILGLELTVRRTTKAQKNHYVWGFIIIGFTGLVAIVWSGTRSASVQNGIAAGIEKIETKLGVATTANRKAIKHQLELFYAEGEKLSEGPPSRASDQYKKYQDSIKDWQSRVVAWMNENISPAAAAKFTEYRPHIASGYIGYENTGPQETWDRNYVSYLCENLDAMIQSDAWDKSQ